MAGTAILVEKIKFVELCGDLSSSSSRGAAPPPKQDDGQNGIKVETGQGTPKAISPELMCVKGRCGGRKASECSASYVIVVISA